MLAVTSAFLAQRDYRSASLSARQLLNHNPRDPDALVLLAEIARAVGSPEAVLWLQRLVEVRPGEAAPLLALATEAIDRRELPIAAQAIAQLPAAARDSVQGHTVAGSLAVLERDWDEAEQHFAAAARLNPGDSIAALNLASLRLREPKSPQAAEACAEIERLSAQASTRVAALRLLHTAARARGDHPAARRFATALHDAPGATPEDRLRLLDELQAFAPAELEPALARAQATADPAVIATLARWMNTHGLGARAAAWLDTFPAATQMLPLLLSVRAGSFASAGDWTGLRQFTIDGGTDWQALEFLRLAYGARAAAELTGRRNALEVTTRWQRALTATAGNYAALSMLASLVQDWGWKAEAAEIWGLLAQYPAGARRALQRAWQIALETRDTAALLRTARRIADLEPQNPAARNNLAWLLLLRGEELPRAHAIAAENLAQHPGVSLLKTTSALSLHLQARSAEAAELLATLPDSLARDPSVSACRGVVLAGAGRRDEALPYLETARTAADKLLPEERTLVEKALAR